MHECMCIHASVHELHACMTTQSRARRYMSLATTTARTTTRFATRHARVAHRSSHRCARTHRRTTTTTRSMIEITQGVSFDTIAREWRCKWSEDGDKASLASAQKVLEKYLPQMKARGSVQRTVCGGCLDFKVNTSMGRRISASGKPTGSPRRVNFSRNSARSMGSRAWRRRRLRSCPCEATTPFTFYADELSCNETTRRDSSPAVSIHSFFHIRATTPKSTARLPRSTRDDDMRDGTGVSRSPPRDDDDRDAAEATREAMVRTLGEILSLDDREACAARLARSGWDLQRAVESALVPTVETDEPGREVGVRRRRPATSMEDGSGRRETTRRAETTTTRRPVRRGVNPFSFVLVVGVGIVRAAVKLSVGVVDAALRVVLPPARTRDRATARPLGGARGY